ncbi:cytochrome c biogenesis CcdA family protein [Candidatus Viridilinea mediisalina]|uniref:Cytochrome C biogenesis protein transmembrane domain-containing protein n=1 Tax=Candidatus Viridilinea mediisalina TaxID=2024553 RepID=A0A2A6RP47_9CHLR|nr:cytochrome c biogenesis protein CcdA [Candidatus Viridilinea mediisalina]PDW04648.1 hypothetical protein CJ255_02405 [Candidatus Viridilinea mediisalina]
MITEQFAFDGSLLTYLLVFLGGIVTSIGPCSVASIPLIMAYVGGGTAVSRGRAFSLAFTFAVGMAITFMLLGIIAALVGGLLGGWSAWFYLLALVCFLIGLHMVGALRLPMPNWFADLPDRIHVRGLPGALVLGLAFGIVASQCATPVLAVILTSVMLSQDGMAYGAALLFIYALGRGMPVVAAGTFAGALRQLRGMAAWTPWIQRVSGVVIMGVGLYLVWIA